MAATLAQVTFSSACRQTHFRVVSRETIGHSGGCVLTKDLGHFYVERFAYGQVTQIPDSIWTFAPSEEPVSVHSSVLPEAICHFGEAGLNFSVTAGSFDTLGWRPITSRKFPSFEWLDTNLAEDLTLHSSIGNAGFKALNLRIELEDNRFSFCTRGPETLLRLVAYLVDGAVIRFDPGNKYPDRKILMYRLAGLASNTSVNGCMLLSSSSAESWLHFPVRDMPEISAVQMASILQRFAIPEIHQSTLSEVLA